MLNFKNFLINEGKFYLGQKSGDILSALQNLQEDAKTMGSRALIRACQNIVNQIRRILHGSWEDEDLQYLKTLQKIGVALMKGIDENQEMEEIIASSVSELEGLLDTLETPINSLGSENEPEEEDEEQPLQKGTEFKA